MKKHTHKSHRGFTSVQLLITIAIAAIVSAFAFVGIVRARAHMRVSGSARQFATLAERARADSVRRHASGLARAGIAQIDGTTYAVTMDFDNSGVVTTRNFSTENGVTILMPFEIQFDWRGRTSSEAQITFEHSTYHYQSLVGITGSGDVTLDSDIFQDSSLPAVTLNGTGGSVIPDPSPTPNGGSSTPTPTATPTPDPNATPTPTPNPTPTPTPLPTPTPTPTATPTPTPSPTPAPSPTPTPTACTITPSKTSVTIAQNTSSTVDVSLVNFVGSGTITATSSNSGQILVTPSSTTVSGSTAKTFTIQVKKTSGYVTFSSACGASVRVVVNVQ